MPLFLAIPGLEERWEEISCYFLLYAQNELPEIKIAALKALNISTKILTMSQRQNYYCIIFTLIKSDITDSIRKETLSCFKKAAKYFAIEINYEFLEYYVTNLNSKLFLKRNKYIWILVCTFHGIFAIS